MSSAIAPSHARPAGTARLAVIGAGPVGLTLALLAAERLPSAAITVFDARAADADLVADPRTLALSLGSVQLLERLGAWPAALSEAITQVHVSQWAPSALARLAQGQVHLQARELGVAQLGAVLGYGHLLSALQRRWLSVCEAQSGRCALRLSTPVRGIKASSSGVEVDADIAEAFDVAVIAEGGVFGEQANKPVQRSYAQRAWVGSVSLGPGAPRGVAVERFTPDGPIALLPLPARSGETSRHAALVWCQPAQGDAIAELSAEQRLALLRQRLPAGDAGHSSGASWQRSDALLAISPLKAFDLGLTAERTLVVGRQVRIGNAAQTLHPVAGQGLNLGLRDAYALVEALASQPPAQWDAALARVSWQRAADRWAMIGTTDLMARAFTWRPPGAAALRGAVLHGLAAVPLARRVLARHLMFGLR